MKKKVLITGISGFAGSHLAEVFIDKKGYEVSGTYFTSASLINLAKIAKKLHLSKVDLTHQKEITSFVKKIKPDLVFHLAALPAVGESFDRPGETIINNIIAQLNLLEAIKKLGFLDCRILVVSSADIYGNVPRKDAAIDEEAGFYPTNTYAISKIGQDFLGLQYFLSYKLKIIRTRPFNHIGPRQSPGFAIADFAQKIAKIEKGKSEPALRVGNLLSRRDFTDVRDMVRAYALLIEKGILGEVYNIGSGVSHKISDMLDILLSFTKAKITIEEDPLLFRPQDSPDRVCDNRKFVKLTNWKPEVSLYQSLKDTLDYWRNIV